jgi:altronate dehydratase
LFLEHGCEKTHNDYMREQLEQRGGDAARYGWASVQLDGGIEAVVERIKAWFEHSLAAAQPARTESAGLEALRVGLLSAGPLPPAAAEAFARLTRSVVGAGGSVVVAQSGSLLESDAFRAGTLAAQPAEPSLAYGEAMIEPGFHIMAAPSGHWVETLTGLGATGVEVLLAYPGERAAQGHPLIPMVQVTAGAAGPRTDFDCVLEGDSAAWAEQLLRQVVDVAARRYVPKLFERHDVDFQITRGLLGMST